MIPAARRSAPGPEGPGRTAGPERALLSWLPAPAAVRLEGKDRIDFLHRLTTNDLLSAAPGQGRYTVFLNTRGRVMDLVLALVLDEAVLLIPSPGNAEPIRALLDGYLFREEVTLRCDEDLAGGLLFGGGARAVLERATGDPLPGGDIGDHRPCRIAGVDGRVARILPMQGDTFRLVFDRNALGAVEGALLNGGGAPASESDLESFRVEAMLPALGRELSEEFNPWEVSLDRAINLQKGCYLGQEVVARLHTYRKVQRRLVGLELSGGIPRLPAPLFDGEQNAGIITSAAPAPDGNRWLALGVVRAALCKPGQELRSEPSDAPITCRVRADAPPLAESFAGPS
ncbi:MAG TPA: glycine cleavage T C-terminal barrel domain-containing protein [Candidatus Polarisedimenticolia bacterium]|nr:glycine cleavage T C-terminal barrel domain-containing protein [Candidatus Polarisedimenticolia bacterium]